MLYLQECKILKLHCSESLATGTVGEFLVKLLKKEEIAHYLEDPPKVVVGNRTEC